MTSADASPARKSGAFVPHDLAAPLRGKAIGPLAGLTAAVKDMFDIAGERAGGGSIEWLATHEPATITAVAVRRLLDAGATIVGKTVCDEFFFSLTGANSRYGMPLNPRALGRVPGGSSCGSASATASGACDFALGSDTGGSVRVPAALCGLYGLRPTHGRVDDSGVMGMARSFDVVGWFAPGAGLLRKLGSVMLDPGGEPGEVGRVLLAEDCFAQADPAVAAVLEKFLGRAAPRLGPMEKITVAPDGFDDWRNCFRTIQGHELWALYGAWIEKNKPDLGPGVKERIAYAATVTAEEAQAARAVQEAARAHIRALVPPGTVLCLPTVPTIAPAIDASFEDLEKFRVRAMALTCIAGVSGLPQVTLPAAMLDGCPLGLSFIGWAGGDEALLDLVVGLSVFCGA